MPDGSLHQKAQRLRIYIDESDRWRGKSLESALVETLHARGMAGATVFRGTGGFGTHSLIHTTRLEALSLNLPVVVEVVDTPSKIEAIMETLYPMVREGLMTLEEVQIVKYTQRHLNPLPADRGVAEAMTRKVASLRADQPIHEAWQCMLDNGVKVLPVIDAFGHVIGILTDEDLLERAGVNQRLSVALRMDTAEINQELEALRVSPLTAADVMTHPAVTVLESETLAAATTRMVGKRLKRLPVLDANGMLVGMLSRLDVLRQVADAPSEIPSAAHILPGTLLTVQDVMNTDVPLAGEGDDLATLIEKFVQSDSHRLIVVDPSGKAVGLISDSDVVSRVQPGMRKGILAALRRIGRSPAGKETAFDLMSPGPLTAAPDLPILAAVRLMLAESRKWLVVIDPAGKPLGLVDRGLLFEAVSAVYGK